MSVSLAYEIHVPFYHCKDELVGSSQMPSRFCSRRERRGTNFRIPCFLFLIAVSSDPILYMLGSSLMGWEGGRCTDPRHVDVVFRSSR